jgi:hypothetical protein
MAKYLRDNCLLKLVERHLHRQYIESNRLVLTQHVFYLLARGKTLGERRTALLLNTGER